jgi:uncharacterized protein (TIGR00645 family)
MDSTHGLSRSLLKSAGQALEVVIFASRWLLVPFYIGLIACVVALLFKFYEILFAFVIHAWSAGDAILALLSLINATLVGSLVLIVAFSGYGNFVSRTDRAGHPAWPMRIDLARLAQMVFTPIVGISAIQVLKALLDIDSNLSSDKLAWLIGIQLAFVVSILLLALSDRISGDRS